MLSQIWIIYNHVLILIVVNEEYSINNYNNSNNIVNNSNSIDSENKNISISDSENISIVAYNVVNWPIGKNRANIGNFLNNVCIFI